ncbi:hypothetical protein NL676_015736 [Syzygium grande]|nr:hypothetical protein NL676_015736 [Syzygium grande]
MDGDDKERLEPTVLFDRHQLITMSPSFIFEAPSNEECQEDQKEEDGWRWENTVPGTSLPTLSPSPKSMLIVAPPPSTLRSPKASRITPSRISLTTLDPDSQPDIQAVAMHHLVEHFLHASNPPPPLDQCNNDHCPKTAAFALLALERLLFRPEGVKAIRVLILYSFQGVGCSVHEVALRSMPDIVVATLERMIDHLRNSMSVDFADLAVLILDEADRPLELGFRAKIHKLV